MPWVRFTSDFDWKPAPQITVAYRAGTVMFVRRICAEAAVAAGVGTLTLKPKDKR